MQNQCRIKMQLNNTCGATSRFCTLHMNQLSGHLQSSRRLAEVPRLLCAIACPFRDILNMLAQGEGKDLGTSTVLRVDAAEKRFVFEGVLAKPVPSLLRNFSAPVKMEVLPTCSSLKRSACNWSRSCMNLSAHPVSQSVNTVTLGHHRQVGSQLSRLARRFTGRGSDGGGPDVPAGERHGPVLTVGGVTAPGAPAAAVAVCGSRVIAGAMLCGWMSIKQNAQQHTCGQTNGSRGLLSCIIQQMVQ